MPEDMHIIGLEGGVCAGKSTTSKIIEGKNLAIRGKEYMDFVLEHQYRTLTDKTPIDRFSFFLEIDKNRIQKKDIDNPVVLDRCFLTLFAYEYAISHIYSKPVDYKIFFKLKEHSFFIPNLVVFLDIHHDVRLERIKKRGPVPYPFADYRFNYFNEEFFRKLSSYLTIKFLDCNALTAEEVSENVVSCMKYNIIPKNSEYISEALMKVFK